MSLENTIQFLNGVKERELAIRVLHVFGKHAQSFEQFDDVSKTFFKIKDYDSASVYGEKAYAIASTPQQMYTIRHNLINIYNHNNYPAKALRYIKANEAVLENDNDRDFEKAFSLFLLNRKPEAATLLRSKLEDPSLTEEQRTKLLFNMGTYDLLEGHFQKGLKGFLLSGEKMGIHATFMNQEHETYGLPRWNGVLKPGIKLLVMAEAGIGDEIINVRFCKTLSEYGIEPIWLTLPGRKDLVEIYDLNGITSYSDIKQIPNDFLVDCSYIPAMQLPIFLNSTYETLWDGPYLSNVPEIENEKWSKKLVSDKLKVGVRWQGNPDYDQDLHRSIPLKDIMDVIPTNVELYSIQKDTGLEELRPFRFINDDGFSDSIIKDLSADLTTLKDLFACIKNLDLVITSCTSIAHIAAAMGKKVCVIVPISCYYVWCNSVERTPWYGDNIQVFYQKTPRVWNEPLKELSEYLGGLV